MVPGSYCPWKEGLLVLFCVTLWEFEALFIVSDVVFDGVFSHVVASVPGSDHATRFLCL